jgi:hypothetical protein
MQSASTRVGPVTPMANWLRGRDDQVGCPIFTPFDRLDANARTGAGRPSVG